MALLDGPGFDAAKLRPEVRDFYEQTSRWRLQVWAQWCSAAWPFGWLLSTVFARRLEQLSLPLRPLDVAHGMTSDVRTVVGPDGDVLGTLWHRRLRSTGDTVFSGWYGVETAPGASRPSVRVVFPLPNGRLVVLLRPDVTADGDLLLTSTPGRWGDDGAYLVVQPDRRHRGGARRIPVHEQFRVFVDDDVLRTDHRLGRPRRQVRRGRRPRSPGPGRAGRLGRAAPTADARSQGAGPRPRLRDRIARCPPRGCRARGHRCRPFGADAGPGARESGCCGGPGGSRARGRRRSAGRPVVGGRRPVPARAVVPARPGRVSRPAGPGCCARAVGWCSWRAAGPPARDSPPPTAARWSSGTGRRPSCGSSPPTRRCGEGRWRTSGT